MHDPCASTSSLPQSQYQSQFRNPCPPSHAERLSSAEKQTHSIADRKSRLAHRAPRIVLRHFLNALGAKRVATARKGRRNVPPDTDFALPFFGDVFDDGAATACVRLLGEIQGNLLVFEQLDDLLVPVRVLFAELESCPVIFVFFLQQRERVVGVSEKSFDAEYIGVLHCMMQECPRVEDVTFRDIPRIKFPGLEEIEPILEDVSILDGRRQSCIVLSMYRQTQDIPSCPGGPQFQLRRPTLSFLNDRPDRDPIPRVPPKVKK